MRTITNSQSVISSETVLRLCAHKIRSLMSVGPPSRLLQGCAREKCSLGSRGLPWPGQGPETRPPLQKVGRIMSLWRVLFLKPGVPHSELSPGSAGGLAAGGGGGRCLRCSNRTPHRTAQWQHISHLNWTSIGGC